MQPNKCPICGEIAITRSHRLVNMKSSFSCMHCQSKLKLHSLSTGLVFMVTGLTIILLYSYYGLNASIILFSVICLLVFIAVLFLIPLEIVNNDDKRP